MSRLDQLRKLAELEPQDPLAHYGVGLECLNLERWDEAAAAFAKAIEVDAGYSAAYYHKARAEIGAGRMPAAQETLTAGIVVAQRKGDMKTEGEMRELLESIA